jgi:hypothetical protein
METTDELLCRALAAVTEANRPAADLATRAYELTAALGNIDATMLIRSITSEFNELIVSTSADDLRNFTAEKSYVLERIRSRNGAGLFDFPAAALLGYWVASKLETAAQSRWPLAGSHAEFNQMLADLGIAEAIC